MMNFVYLLLRVFVSPLVFAILVGVSMGRLTVWVFDFTYDFDADMKATRSSTSFMEKFLRG